LCWNNLGGSHHFAAARFRASCVSRFL
ncbi:DUF6685 family protein, partial [Klebsiella sp. A-Nf5]